MRGIIIGLLLLVSSSTSSQMYMWKMSVVFPTRDSCINTTVIWGFNYDTVGFVVQDTLLLFYTFEPRRTLKINEEEILYLKTQDKQLYKAAKKINSRWREENISIQRRIDKQSSNPSSDYREKIVFVLEATTLYRYIIRWVTDGLNVHIQFFNFDRKEVECVMSLGINLCKQKTL